MFLRGWSAHPRQRGHDALAALVLRLISRSKVIMGHGQGDENNQQQSREVVPQSFFADPAVFSLRIWIQLFSKYIS